MEVRVPCYERSSGVGGDVAARVKNCVCVVQLSVSNATGVGVCFLRVEEVFASKDEVAAAVVSVLLEVNLCFADVCCVNGDVIGGNVLALENVSSIPTVETDLACCDAGVQGRVLDFVPNLGGAAGQGVSPLLGALCCLVLVYHVPELCVYMCGCVLLCGCGRWLHVENPGLTSNYQSGVSCAFAV